MNSPKIRSLLSEAGQGGGSLSQRLKSKYDEIYGSPDVWLYPKSHGVHSVIVSCVREELKSARVLDVGCGAGRLALMSAVFAESVHGFDFSERAIEMARANALCAGIANVTFSVDEVDSFCNKEQRAFDTVYLVGVLEHVPDPVHVLRQLAGRLRSGGLLVVSCPNFLNLRGASYMTLLTLLSLPMSLADLRQVWAWDVDEWGALVGLRRERTVGAIYDFGWGHKAARDMIKRVPAAATDAGLDLGEAATRYAEWQDAQRVVFVSLLQRLEAVGLLKRIERTVEFRLENRARVPDDLWTKMTAYIHEDIESDPYYSDVDPVCCLGGEAIYFLRRAG